MNSDGIETVLKELAPVASHCADDLLDIRDAVVNSSNPGTCIKCYFSIYGALAERSGHYLHPLRTWLENHVEIIASDTSQNVLESIPVTLRGADLQAYCEDIMREFFQDRAYSHEVIHLRFRFREAA